MGKQGEEPMSAAVQTLDISPVGRVEGDLDVRVDIEDGVVTNAWTQAELFRGFEVILRDKDPQAGLVVTPRACGICGASHLTCAAWALDTAWGTTVPRNAILARNLGQITESLQSLPRHHYGLFMIDFTNRNYSDNQHFQEAVKRYAPFTGTSYEAGVTISGRPVEIYALLGGQWPHSSYMVPGGVMCAPTLTDVTRAWSILEHFRRNWIEPLGSDAAWSATRKSGVTMTSRPGWTSGPSMPIPISACIGAWAGRSVSTNTAVATANSSRGGICRMRTATRSRRSKAAMRRWS
jgi:Ni,Fe-hydrogenase I large subunit